MTRIRHTPSRYMEAFARLQRDSDDDAHRPLQALRRRAMERFGELGFPGPRDEEWRHTHVASLAETDFVSAPDTAPLPTPADIAPYLLEGSPGPVLVFVNGRHTPQLSILAPPHGNAVIKSLAVALKEDTALVSAHLGQYAEYDQQAFTALNTALFGDGAFIHVRRRQEEELTIQLLFLTTADDGPPVVCYPRLLLLADDNVGVNVVESHVGLCASPYLTNMVAEMVLGQGARVDHYRIQREGSRAAHIADLRVIQAGNASFRSTCVTLGGALTRNHVHTLLKGEGVESSLAGLYLTTGSQHVDNHTLIEHCAPHGRSHEHYKGIMDRESSGVFRGKILVHREAQQTDAYQANGNLLLSDQARINTKPQLEIYADDVKCSHGATIGQLDPEAVFYLRSRGISQASARRLLTRAFAGEIVQRIQLQPLREQLETLVTRHLSGDGA